MTAAELVRYLGLPGKYTGYKQMVTAITLVVEDEDRLLNIYKEVYAVVGKDFSATPKGIERNLRTLINAAWVRNEDTRIRFQEIAGYSFLRRPSVSDFLDVTASYLQKEQSFV